MINNPPLDKHIKEKFGDYSPDVPAHIWENIIAEKNKRKPAGFWFSFLNQKILLLFLAIAVAGAGVIIYRNSSSVDSDKKIARAERETRENKKENNIISEANNEATNKKIVPITLSGNKTPKPGINNLNTKKDFVAGTNKISTGNNNLLPTSVKNKESLSANNDKIDHTNDIITNSGNRKSKRIKGLASISFQSPDTETDNDIEEENSAALLLNRQLLSLEMIRFAKDINTSIKLSNNPYLDIPCPEAEKNVAGNKRYFEIYGGPDYAFRSITDTGNSAYAEKRKESVSFSYAFSIGLRYSKVFGNGMSFRTGINYSQINEKFKFAQGNIIQVIYVTNSNGDTTGSYTTTSTRYKKTHNKFRTVDIPVMVGYELGNGRWHANFNAGVVVNLYSWQKGDVLDTAYQPISITTGKSSSPYQLKTNVGIGFMGAVSVYYKISDRFHLLAEPYYRYNFSPATKSELTLKQKYNTAGLRLGVRLDF